MQSSTSRALGKLTDLTGCVAWNLHIFHCMVWQGTARNMSRPQGHDPTLYDTLIILIYLLVGSSPEKHGNDCKFI